MTEASHAPTVQCGPENWWKLLTDPPCCCGNTLGLPNGAQPRYAAGTTGVAHSAHFTYAAVRVPRRAKDLTIVMSDVQGRATGRFTLTPGGMHIMASPVGQQYTCSADLVGKPGDMNSTAHYICSAEPMAETNEDGAYDPRFVALRHAWARLGFPGVEVWRLRRIGSVTVRGQLEMHSVRTRWFTRNGRFLSPSPNYAVEEPDGILRFPTIAQMRLEFADLRDASGNILRTSF